MLEERYLCSAVSEDQSGFCQSSLARHLWDTHMFDFVDRWREFDLAGGVGDARYVTGISDCPLKATAAIKYC